ncbi:MAG TPA: hypothetical protein VKC64_03045 [Burkholderiales bacterium]|nr:hypothetical protein [Burkholderiales bacterium]
MKRSLIALALAGLLANVAFAQVPDVTAQDSKSVAKEESEQAQKSNTYGQYGVYEFNP